MSLQELPTEIWAKIFEHIPLVQIVTTFDALSVNRIFGETRLDAFWKCVAFDRTLYGKDSVESDPLNCTQYQDAIDNLINQGYTRESALWLFQNCMFSPEDEA